MSQSDQVDLATIRKLAKLSKLTLTEEEENLYQKELSAIVSFVQQLQSVDLSQQTPTYQVGDLVNVVRPDENYKSDPDSWPDPNKLLESCHLGQLTEDGHLRVPKII